MAFSESQLKKMLAKVAPRRDAAAHGRGGRGMRRGGGSGGRGGVGKGREAHGQLCASGPAGGGKGRRGAWPAVT